MKVIIFFFILFPSSICFAQGETWNWSFGDSAGIKFINGKYPIAVTIFKGFTFEGTATLSDKGGNLLYYSFDNFLYDKNHQRLNTNFKIKTNNSSCQTVQLVKHLSSNDIHIFTTSAFSNDFGSFGFHHYIYNNGFKLINQQLKYQIGEKQTSIFNLNGKDIWVTTHSLLNDTFFSYLVKPNEIIDCPVINISGAKYQDRYPSQGLLKFSPSGRYCASANWDLNRVEIYYFDKESSKLYNLISIEQLFPYSIEFSPDENYLYFTDRGEHIYQVSLKKWDKDSIEKSKTVIKSATYEKYYQMQLASNNKIYIANGDLAYLSCINDPNKSGSKTNFKDSAIYLNGRKSEGGLPNFNSSYFYTPSIDYAYEQDCRTNTITFEGKDTIKATNYEWVFSKGTKTDTKTTKDASYTFADTGKWQVKYIASTGSRSDTVIKTITIWPKLEQGFLGKDINYCLTLPTLHALKNLHCIHWYVALGDTSVMEVSKADSLLPNQEGTYYAKATNLSFCVEWDTIKVIKPSPKADFETKDVCESDSAVFVNKSENANNYIWKFGDGQMSNKQSAKHKYQITNTTTYNVTIVAKMDACSDSITKPITVNQNPNSDFTYKLTGSNVDLKAKPDRNKYEWRFGTSDSFTSTLPDYNRTINVSTQKNVCLKVTNLAGCVSVTCKDVTLGISPIIKDNDIKIYPNPSKGKLTIEISNAVNYQLYIYTETGQLVIEKSIKGGQVITVLLKEAKGVYLVEVLDESGNKIVKKVVVE